MTKTTHVMDVLTEARPHDPAPGRRERDDDLAVILASPRATGEGRAAAAPRPRRRTRLAWRAAGVLATATVAAVVVQAVAVSPPVVDGGGGVSASAAQLALRDLAKVAAEGDQVVPPPNGFWYTRTLEVDRDVWPVDDDFSPDARFWVGVTTSTGEFWVSSSRPGRSLTSDRRLTFPTEQDRRLYQAWRAKQADPDAWLDPPAGDEFTVDPASGPGSPTITDLGVPLRELPREPDALTARACPENTRITPEYRAMDRWDCMTRLLTIEAAGPALRAAAFEAVSRLPGVELVGKDVADRKGRHGVGIAMKGEDSGTGPVRDVVIFDPDTARMLSFERTKIGLRMTPELEKEPRAMLGLLFARVYLESGTTRTAGERP